MSQELVPSATEPLMKWLRHQLLHPDVREIIRALDGGPLPENARLRTMVEVLRAPRDKNRDALPPELDECLVTWFNAGGDLDVLARALEESPDLFHHFLVENQINYMAAGPDGPLSEFFEFGPALIRQRGAATRDALRRLVAGWARGLFPECEVIIAPKKCRGNPGRLKTKERRQSAARERLRLFKKVLTSVHAYWLRRDPYVFRQRPHETRADFLRRLAEVAQDIYEYRVLATGALEKEPALDPKGNPVSAGIPKAASLAFPDALSLAALAAPKRNASAITLVYGLLVLAEGQRPTGTTVRGMKNEIHRAEAEFPDLATPHRASAPPPITRRLR
jgi:hypothetical protein